MKRRIIEEKIFKFLMKASAFMIVFVIVVILVSIFAKGYSSISLEMLTQSPKGGYYLGREGGILNAIVGSFYLAGGATLISVII